MNTRQCGNILHFFSGGGLQNGITKHSDTFAPPKLLVSAIPSNQSTQKVQKQKFEPCYCSGNWNLSSVTLWTLISVCPFAQWAELPGLGNKPQWECNYCYLYYNELFYSFIWSYTMYRTLKLLRASGKHIFYLIKKRKLYLHMHAPHVHVCACCICVYVCIYTHIL